MHRFAAIHKSFSRFFNMPAVVISLLMSLLSAPSFAAVILQYHHVSNDTPKITSISPSQFSAHLALLKEKQYTVIALPELLKKMEAGQDLTNHVAITFDDGYINLLEHAVPELERYQYPYTIFVNPDVVDKKVKNFLTWADLKKLGENGATIANHGLHHDSLARIPTGTSVEEWTQMQGQQILQAEARIKEQTGQSVRLYAYPYGEYIPQVQQWFKENNFTAFSQQSGAVASFTDKTQIPRFPVSYPYDQLESFSDKLNTLAFDLTPAQDSDITVVNHGFVKELVMRVNTMDFHPKLLACYVSGMGKQEVTWLDERTFKVTLDQDLKPGRQRSNCTAPSISKPSRYYWYSKPWFVLKPDGTWFPL